MVQFIHLVISVKIGIISLCTSIDHAQLFSGEFYQDYSTLTYSTFIATFGL